MKRFFCMLMAINAIILVIPVSEAQNRPQPDPLIEFAFKMNRLERFSYNAKYLTRSFFDKDTMVSEGRVKVMKIGDEINFLHVTGQKGMTELLYYGDSLWVCNKTRDTLTFLGTDISRIAGNPLGNFVPLSLLTLDTSIAHIEPFWNTVRENGGLKTVEIHIADIPPEFSSLKAEAGISQSDSLLRSLTEIATMGDPPMVHFQQKLFSNYETGRNEEYRLPGYWDTAPRVFPPKSMDETAGESIEKTEPQILYLTGLELFELSGEEYTLPGDGLVFIDLWYAGCYPCLKSAPVIEKLYLEFKDRIHFLTVNEIDRDTAKIARYKDLMALSFPVLLNPGENICNKIQAGGYPTYLLLDAETAQVRWHSTGYHDDLESLLRQAFMEHLE